MRSSRSRFALAALLLLSMTPYASAAPFAYVNSSFYDYTMVVNLATNTIISTVDVQVLVPSNPYAIAVLPNGSRIYVTENGGRVVVINGSTNSFHSVIQGSGTFRGIAVNPTGTRLYTTVFSSNQVAVIDTVANSFIGNITVGTSPWGVVVSPDGSKVYVTNVVSESVSVIDPVTSTVVATIPLAPGSSPRGLAISPDGAKAYVTCLGSDSLAIIDTVTNTVTNTLPTGVDPEHVAFTPDGSTAYVGHTGASPLAVIDTATETVVTTIGMNRQDGVSVTPDGTRAYVPSSSTTDIYVVDTASNTVVDTISDPDLRTARVNGSFIGPVCPNDCSDGNPCTDDVCNLVTGCTNPLLAAGTVCADDGEFCNGDEVCDSAGNCGIHAGDPCAGGPLCNNTCSESMRNCQADTGMQCEYDANECVFHFCHEGACERYDAYDFPCDDGAWCNGADSCFNGSCDVHAGDPCAGADGDSNCVESCDESSDTCSATDPNGSACSDGVFCNGPDTCDSGVCQTHSGDPCAGPDGDGDCSETCDETAGACSGSDPDGGACNDGSFCNGTETCTGGTCSSHTGDPCAGADGDGDCSETCDETAGACSGSDPNGSACNDDAFCNGADTCAGGTCSSHSGDPCAGADGDGNCTESCDETADTCSATDPNGSACSDGVFCNGPDTCDSGVCQTHSGDPCAGPDGDGDCSETCDETAGACSGSDPDGGACNDGAFCNGTDTCADGTCSSHSGDPCTGADGDGDCSESCDEMAGACSGSDPNGSACNDDAFCNGADTCAGGTCSSHSGDPCAGADGDGDCSESCDESGNECSAADGNGSACNDGDVCTSGENCTAGTCAGGTAASCDDGDLCTTDSCDAVDGCEHDGDPADAGTCFEAGKSTFALKNTGDEKSSIKWSWKKGGEVLASDLGSPASTTTYALCVFDETAGVPSLAGSWQVGPSSTLWTEKLDNGQVSYVDKAGSSDGITSLKAKAAATGKSGMSLKATGSNLVLPSSGPTQYFDMDSVVTVQLRNSAGACWSSEFTEAKKNATETFQATAP